MIDISDGGGYEKIRWRPYNATWPSDCYIYFMKSKFYDNELNYSNGFLHRPRRRGEEDGTGEPLIGIRGSFGIDWSSCNNKEWVDKVLDDSGLTLACLLDFVDMANAIWDSYWKQEQCFMDLAEKERMIASLNSKKKYWMDMYDSCDAKWRGKLQELREKWRYEYQRIMSAHKRDIEYWGGEKKFIEVSPEIVNLRRLQLELLREIRNTRS